MPVLLFINTDEQRFEIWQPGVLQFNFYPSQEKMMRLKIFHINIPLARNSGNKTKNNAPVKSKKKSKSKRSWQSWIFLVHGILASFRIKRIEVKLDCGDVVFNAKLIPVVILFNGAAGTFNVNFVGRNYLYLYAQVRLNKILWNFIRFLTKK